MKRVRVVLADDHAGVRGMVREILKAAPELEVVGEAGNGVEALEVVQACQPDVLLLDMEMPLMNGVQVAARLKAVGASVRILAISAYDDRSYIEGVLESGAAGYVLKDDLPGNLIEVVRGVAQGRKGWLSAQLIDTKPPAPVRKGRFSPAN